jgi:hypothetical protein
MPLDAFKKTKLPTEIPLALTTTIKQLSDCQSQTACLNLAYDILSQRFYGRRAKTYSQFWKVWQNNVETVWEKEGFLHCTNINFLLRFLLVKSGWFKDEEIKLKWTSYLFISPHQYVTVEADKKIITVDIWAKFIGIQIGDYAHGFHSQSKEGRI